MNATPSTSHLSFLREINPRLYGELGELTKMGLFQEAHAQYFELCRHVKKKTSEQPLPEEAPELARKGFSKVPRLISQETCERVQSVIESALASKNSTSQDLMQGFEKLHEEHFGESAFHKNMILTVDQLPAIKEAMREAMTPELVAILERTLRSHFYINHFMLSRTYPTDRPVASFTWHRDAAVNTQIHLMLYLTDSGESGKFGATDFLPRRATKTIEERYQYSFNPPETRVLDLKELGTPEEILNQVERPQLSRGDGMAFASSNVLHKGIAPQEKFRDALLLIIHPSILPWDAMLERTGLECMLHRQFGYSVLPRHPADP